MNTALFILGWFIFGTIMWLLLKRQRFLLPYLLFQIFDGVLMATGLTFLFWKKYTGLDLIVAIAASLIWMIPGTLASAGILWFIPPWKWAAEEYKKIIDGLLGVR